MRLAILTQYYPPDIGAAPVRLSALAREFVRRGHCVTVLTAMPSYPAGRLQPGYGGMWCREQQHGVNILRSFVYATQRSDFARRLANYFSFVLSSGVFGSFLLEEADYLIVESPPLFMGLTGIWLSRLKGARMVFNVSDLWPESAVRLGVLRRDSTAYRLSVWLERLCYRQAWAVSGQSHEIVADISRRFPHCRTLHLSNGVDTETFRPDSPTTAARQLLDGAGRCVVLYAGLHGLAQGLDLVVDAAEALSPDSGLNVVLMGDGPHKAKLVRRVQESASRAVRVLDPRPHAEMPGILAAADVVLVALARHIPGAVPSKLYEAMSSGRPVVLIAEGEAAQIVRKHAAGLVVTPGDVAGLVGALRTLAADAELRRRMGANGRAAALQDFDRTKIVGRFIEFLEQHLHGRVAQWSNQETPRSIPIS